MLTYFYVSCKQLIVYSFEGLKNAPFKLALSELHLEAHIGPGVFDAVSNLVNLTILTLNPIGFWSAETISRLKASLFFFYGSLKKYAIDNDATEKYF